MRLLSVSEGAREDEDATDRCDAVIELLMLLGVEANKSSMLGSGSLLLSRATSSPPPCLAFVRTSTTLFSTLSGGGPPRPLSS